MNQNVYDELVKLSSANGVSVDALLSWAKRYQTDKTQSFHEYLRPSEAEVIWQLEQKSSEALTELWKRPLCFECDYGGYCRCSMAGGILAARGEDIRDRYGAAVKPLRLSDQPRRPSKS